VSRITGEENGTSYEELGMKGSGISNLNGTVSLLGVVGYSLTYL